MEVTAKRSFTETLGPLNNAVVWQTAPGGLAWLYITSSDAPLFRGLIP